ncbi:transposase [Streptomyces sp. NPDC058964]|uniref:transposase n=1 Tax=Streptomyces sp. NPDC058964 TaxID=3346681 RepID=UPI0036A5ED05
MVPRHELTDAQWQMIEPLLPANGEPGGQWADHRTVVNGVLYRARTGVPPGRTCPSGTAPGKPCMRRRGIKATIAQPENQRASRRRKGRAGGRPPAFDKVQYRRRSAVERCVSKWKQYRAVASRYDRRDYTFNGTLAVAAIVIWLRDIAQEPSEAT